MWSASWPRSSPYDDWALDLREQAREAYASALRTRARLATDDEEAVRAYLRLLEHDRWDAGAHRELIARLDADDGFQCATAQVPLDYDRPAGPKLTLALIRLPASDPAHRLRSLFTNPGGPGNSGVAFVRDVYTDTVRARFDVVGFDPRGVGSSTPVRCLPATGEPEPPFPVGREQEQAFAAAQADLGRRCRAGSGELLDHLSTANVARDMDVLRAAVGDPKLTFIGHSYGSHLGATYANLFPQRVRAIACGETDNPRLPGVWPLAAGIADRFTPYFGASWAYISHACATWPGRDTDRYAGPFNRKTAAPLLLVNSRFDAASSYERAQVVERTLGSARLLTIEGAGHTQGTIDSACADRAIERYLIAGELPAPGAVCADQPNPFRNVRE